MSRNYNKKMYGAFAKGNKYVRNKSTSKIIEPLGFIFKLIFNLIKKPLHLITFSINSLFYDKTKDSPYKGSILYTIIHLFLISVLCLGALAFFTR